MDIINVCWYCFDSAENGGQTGQNKPYEECVLLEGYRVDCVDWDFEPHFSKAGCDGCGDPRGGERFPVVLS